MEKKVVIFIFFLFSISLWSQVIDDGFETGDFTACDWLLSGDADWFVTDNYPYDGEYCAQGGNVSDNQATTIEIDIDCPQSGIFSFSWKVSSEEDYDFLRFYLDDTRLAQIHGSTGWALVGYQLTTGVHNLRWSYEKDYSVSNGSDTGWIDNIKFEIQETSYDQDLRIADLTGPSHLYGGESCQFEVTVCNNGQSGFTGYTVSLVDSSGYEFASDTIFWILPPGEEIVVELNWVPESDFPDSLLSIYACGNLSNDENPANDCSHRKDLHIIPADYQFAVIGTDETSTNQIPLNFTWKTSLTEMLYFSQEIQAEGQIFSLDFFNSFSNLIEDVPIRIWLGESDVNTLSDSWISSDSLQLVFDGNIDLSEGNSTVNIVLEEQFIYQGNNLVMLIEREYDENPYSWQSSFYFSDLQGIESGRTRYDFNDHHDLDPQSPSGGILCNWVANTVFTFGPISDNDQTALIIPAHGLGKIYPNPFFPGTNRKALSIEVFAEEGCLDIYDLRGRKVKSIPFNMPGTIRWNGIDSRGKVAASGIYLLKLDSEKCNDQARMMLVK